MPRRLVDRYIFPTVLATGLAGAVTLNLHAGELSPYSLPSQQRPVVPEVRQQAMPRYESRADDSYYRRFASDAATLTPKQRADLEKSFSQSRDQSMKVGRVEEAQHYSRLISILQANR